MKLYPDPHNRPGRWLARHYVTGKARSKTIRADTKRDALRQLAAWVATLSPERQPRERSPRLADYVSEFVASRRGRYHTRASWDSARGNLRHLVIAFGEVRVDRFDDSYLAEYQRTETARGMAATTINARIKWLARVLGAARADGYTTRSLPLGAVKIKEHRQESRIRAFDASDVSALVRVARATDPHMERAIMILCHTGMRPCELVAMRWGWIDHAERLIRIPCDRTFRPKNNKPRDIPFDDSIARYLDPECADFASEYVWPAVGRATISGCYRGNRYTRWPNKRFRPILQTAGCAWADGYTARHTYASHFIASWHGHGDCYAALGAVLGHSHARITELYAHVLAGQHERARGVVRFDVGPEPSPGPAHPVH